jgi:hypothetical protein
MNNPVIVYGIGTPITHTNNQRSQIITCLIECATFMCLAKNKWNYHGNLQVFSLSLCEINKALHRKNLMEKGLYKIIPSEYHNFLPLFQEVVEENYHLIGPITIRY